MNTSEMQIYFRSLFRGLAAVHKQGIIHRDIKPTYVDIYPPQFTSLTLLGIFFTTFINSAAFLWILD